MKGDCKLCQCYYLGTQQIASGPPLCDQLSGQCRCKAHVVGTNCEQCEDGYYNIDSGEVREFYNSVAFCYFKSGTTKFQLEYLLFRCGLYVNLIPITLFRLY